MKLLIPSQCIELTGEVQRVLLLAEQQGFAIGHIELGVSPTPYLQLVGDTTLSLSCNWFTHVQPDADWVLHYGAAAKDLPATHVHDGWIFISEEPHQGRVIDRWQHSDEVRYLHQVKKLEPADCWRHLAWVLACLSLDFPIEDALVLSRAALNVSRETWPCDYRHFPQPQTQADLSAFPTLTPESLGVYPVVDDVRWIAQLLPLGITTIQLRIKDPHQTDLEQQVIEAIRLGREFGAQVFINDYWQLAAKHGAYGVHLGQEDLQTVDLNVLLENNLRLGLSTHGYFELLRIHQLAPSYIALGHIFPTTTKQMPSKPQGLVRLALYQRLLDSMPYGDAVGVPSVAIGGIDALNAEQVLVCGVSSIAVVRAITEAKNVAAAVDTLQHILASSLASAKERSNVVG
ncbi:thiamine phosphate synthase [Vibrio fluvialis]|uniref:thiamine phosphate synthase n=1 Tax=Vibrio fluvialis TaxID=676 RepID=UPI001558D9AB|nr:thiamine phosphate synthase [Vibrio fluvialis]EKO3948764.1 thiamine phosphate synthase [Vibrio fluvialis]ELV8595418.1 thiamine phosphate synthase [Vibrio fluvialis]MBY7907488.1 thiamine phosphate synthase [Vibrio fluvialis]MBY8177200.1 thiamine phosphate synthase [Vibrio fluvialis]MBY8198179.1 thiamine phosphate synthase [Vibrio fluvialis]